LKNLHVVELNHFSSMFWINCIYLHQLITFTIMDKCCRATRPFLFLNWFWKVKMFSDIEFCITFQWSSNPLVIHANHICPLWNFVAITLTSAEKFCCHLKLLYEFILITPIFSLSFPSSNKYLSNVELKESISLTTDNTKI
jgi:hypothetical protein